MKTKLPQFLRRSLAAKTVAGLLLAGLLVMSPVQAAVHYERLKSFGNGNFGFSPEAPVIQGSDGMFYGTSYFGGPPSSSAVFKLNKDGSGAAILHSFQAESDGQHPLAALLEGSDGALYGSMSEGGIEGGGTLFRLNKDGSAYSVLHTFGGNGEGYRPIIALVEARDGTLYGTTSEGNNSDGSDGFDGTVFKLNKDGSDYSILHKFSGSNGDTDGASPGMLLAGSDGVLYGTARNGGSNGSGTVFRLNTDGTGYRVLVSLSNSFMSGMSSSALSEGNDGILYGTTDRGGANDLGTVFKLNKDGSDYHVLHSFDDSGGLHPNAPVAEGKDGALYGTTGTTMEGGTIFRLNKDGSGFSLLHIFDETNSLSYSSPSGLLEGSDGRLYGTTVYRGGNAKATVFKLSKDGSGYSVVYTFGNGTGNGDGSVPVGLVEGSDGVLYGTTAYGGAKGGISTFPGRPFQFGGTVFKINKDGSGYNILHNLADDDGLNPMAGLIEGRDGALYGTTSGVEPCPVCDVTRTFTVFKLDKDGSTFKVLHSGVVPEDVYSESALVQGSDGALYGTIPRGGVGYGTAFKLNEDGSGYTILHDFSNATGEGFTPNSGLLEASDGALYGSALDVLFKLNKDGSSFSILNSALPMVAVPLEGSDGVLYGVGRNLYSDDPWSLFLFRVNKDGSDYNILHTFTMTHTNEIDFQNHPAPALVEGRDGALYGTTLTGGNHDAGMLFRVTKDGSNYSVLYNFGAGASDGINPVQSVQGSDGVFYGVTRAGGDSGIGTLFKIWPIETPDLIGVTAESNSRQVSVAGISGCQYQLLRSSDLTTWSVLTTFAMPSAGIYTYTDSTSTTPSAYYRAAWVP